MGDSKNWKINKNNNSEVNSNTKDKYKLREASIKKRIEVEHRKKEPKKRGPKPRPKSQPMSKYRRKTANLRERQRMGEINVGFEKLRAKIPTPVQPQSAKCEKMTKINILHVAINYIRALESIIDTGDAGVHVYGTSVVQSPNLPISPEAEPPVEKVAKNPPKSTPNSIRRGNNKQQQQQQKTTTTTSTKTATATKTINKTTTTRTKNPSSSSSSEDSGINMDSEDLEEDSICPDWTELTSTLELFPIQQQHQQKFGNLDTLLSSTAANSQQLQQQTSLSKVLQPKDLNFRYNHSNTSTTSNLPLDLDFFGDL